MKWISVKDRLPKDGEDVLVSYKHGRGDMRIAMSAYHHGKSNNYFDEGCCCNWFDSCKVLYWMPLPEPPKD